MYCKILLLTIQYLMWSANPLIWIGWHLIYKVITWSVVYVAVSWDLLAHCLCSKYTLAFSYYTCKVTEWVGGCPMSSLDTLHGWILNCPVLIELPWDSWELNIELPWAHWTSSAVEYSTTMSSLDIFQNWILNYHELIGHPPPLNIELKGSVDTLGSWILNYHELIGCPRELNIEHPWAHWTSSAVEYWTPMSSWDTLNTLILNCGELIGHPLEFNIELWWAHQTLSGP